MIGGAMLLCAVSAMAVIIVWSIRRDDMADVYARDGFLALKNFTKTKKYSHKNKEDEKPEHTEKNRQVQKLRKMRFNPDEMAEIEDEAEATLPEFVRNARREY